MRKLNCANVCAADMMKRQSSVVKHLSECQYLDDRAFAEYWVTNRLRLKSMGKRRLRQELRDKGVADEIVEAVLNNCAPLHDERDLALALARQRAQGKSPTKRELRRLSGFLYRRGFSGADDAVLRKLMLNQMERKAFLTFRTSVKIGSEPLLGSC